MFSLTSRWHYCASKIKSKFTRNFIIIMFRNTLSISATCVFLLAGCGGGGSSSSDDTGSANVLTGIFVDSAVEGVSYTTETRSDVTNATGEFSYLQGENVTFSIGSLTFPTIPAAAQVSPVDMA
jgi:hypothetical protein